MGGEVLIDGWPTLCWAEGKKAWDQRSLAQSQWSSRWHRTACAQAPGGALVGRSWHVVLGPGSKLKWTATVQMSKEFACKECAPYSRRLSMHLRPYFRICFLVFLSVVSKTFNRKKGSDKLTFPFKRSSTKSDTNRPHLKVSVMYNWGFDW